MKRKSLWAGWVLAALLAAGCASAPEPQVSMSSRTEFAPEDYPRLLNRWSRSDEVFDGLFSVLFAHATFHSPEFRRAFLIRHPQVYGRGSEEAGRLTLTSPKAEEHLEFFMSASTSNQRWNDLDQEDSIWRVTLQSDELVPVQGKVRMIKTTANVRVFYPYITPYASTYGLTFPLTNPDGKPLIGPDTSKLTLRISSALGEAELVWRLARRKS